jgi:hypothetical protein
MNDLADTAQRLRHVKQATRHFLQLWALEQARERARRGGEDVTNPLDDLDTAAVEAAILELNVYASDALVRCVTAED